VSIPSVMIVLPTLGERLPSLELALDSCSSIPTNISATVFLVSPSQATKARALGATYGAVIVEDPGSGMAGAINAAVQAGGNYSYYVWLGDDDLVVGEGIALAIAALEQDSQAVVAHGYCDYIDEDGHSIALNRAGKVAQFLLPWGPNLIPHPGTVIRLDALRRVGGFSLGYSYALDLDVFLRLRKQGRFLAVPAVTARFRWHPNSLTVADRKASSREAMAIKSQYLPGWLRWASPLWHQPVAWASAFAARRLNGRALKGRA